MHQGWVAYYQGEEKPGVTYAAAYTEWNSLKVTSPSAGEVQPTSSPSSPTGIPIEYVYAAVAVIVIAIIAIGAYAYTKKTKNNHNPSFFFLKP